MYKRRKKACASIIMFVFIVMVVSVHQVDSSAITRNKGFSPSAYEYTNKTIHFETGDPYDGYNTWTFAYQGGVQGPSDGKYYVDTDTSGYTQYFGYDEFSSQNDIMAHVVFRTTVIAGTYRFQPIHYVYQKINLESSTHTALGLVWHSGGLRLDWNTENGDTPTLENLVATAPVVNHEYSILLANSGNDTWVRVYDCETSSVVYNGTTTTFNYNATALYAGLGQYSGGDGNIYGSWDNFTIVDSSLYYEVIPAGALWGLDVSLIILGLCMIPASTLYLAYGVKHDRSDDRLFYGLIMFFLGCGLFIGGIIP